MAMYSTQRDSPICHELSSYRAWTLSGAAGETDEPTRTFGWLRDRREHVRIARPTVLGQRILCTEYSGTACAIGKDPR